MFVEILIVFLFLLFYVEIGKKKFHVLLVLQAGEEQLEKLSFKWKLCNMKGYGNQAHHVFSRNLIVLFLFALSL